MKLHFLSNNCSTTFKAKHSKEYLHCMLRNILRRYKDFLEAGGQH